VEQIAFAQQVAN